MISDEFEDSNSEEKGTSNLFIIISATIVLLIVMLTLTTVCAYKIIFCLKQSRKHVKVIIVSDNMQGATDTMENLKVIDPKS